MNRAPHWNRRTLLCLGTLLLATPPSGWSQSTAADPHRICFEAARDGARDAYVCDLAVQMAGDAGDATALAAALANRSLVLAGDGRLEPALADLNQALAQTPDNAELHGNHGNLLLRLGRAAEALAAHNRAVQLTPEDPVAYYNRAFSYRALGEPQRAAADVAAAQALRQGAGRPVTRAETRAAAERRDR